MRLTGRAIREQARQYPESVEGFEQETEQLEVLPAAFTEGTWEQEDLEWIVDWKSRRAAGYFQENEPSVLNEVIDETIRTAGPARKLETLLELKGVGVPMASAILVFMDPAAYTVLDQFAWKALEEAGHLDSELSNTPTKGEYLSYLGVCHGLANDLGVSLRTLDRGLWMLGR